MHPTANDDRVFGRHDQTHPERNRVRRRSEFIDPPPRLNLARGDRARLMALARDRERQTYVEAKLKARAKAQSTGKRARPVHGGELGRAGLRVLEALLFDIPKRDDCLFPSLETIAAYARASVPTVVKAIKRLVLAGFLTVHRRCKVIRSILAGWRVVQDSNAYVPHPPTGLGALGTFARPWLTDLKNWRGKPKPKENEDLSMRHERPDAPIAAAVERAEGPPMLFCNFDAALAYRRRLMESKK